VTTHPSERLLVVGVFSRTRSLFRSSMGATWVSAGGCRRRQLHTMFKQSNYDPLAASGAA
jgi:hypothetical protein